MNDAHELRFPVSAAQRGIWLGQQLDPHSARYNAAECVELRGPVDTACLMRAVERCVAEAEGLHVRFVPGASEPELHLGAPRALSVEQVDLSHHDDPRAAAFAFMQADVARVMDLENGPLVRSAILCAGPEHAFWYFAAHHAVLDGFGFALIEQRVAALYSAAVTGKAAPPASFAPLRGVIDEDLAYRASPARLADRDFWCARLRDLERVPSFGPEAALPSDGALRASAHITALLKERLDQLPTSQRASWVDGLIAAFSAYLACKAGAEDVVLGLPVMNRIGAAALRVPSMVMNIVPLRVRVSPDASLATLALDVNRELSALRPHARYRYEELRRDLNRLGGSRRLFGPVVNVMPFGRGLYFAGARAEKHTISAGPVEDLALNVEPDASGLRLRFEANPAIYTEGELTRLRDGLLAFLRSAVCAPTAPLVAATRLQGAEPAAEWLRGAPLDEAPVDVIVKLLEHARTRPEARAVEHGVESLTYGALVDRAARIAAELTRRGAGPEVLVAVALPRGLDAITTIVGVLMASAAYVPLDPHGPPERTRTVLEDAQPSLTIVEGENFAERLGWQGPCATVPTLLEGSPSDPLREARGEQLAYVIYTSGSTGQPNGVMIERAALAHFVAAAAQRYAVRGSDRVLQFAPLQFDASVEEIFVTLCTGATLVLRDDAMLESMPRFLEAVSRLDIHVLDLPTAFWHELVYALEAGDLRWPRCVHTVIIGGEAALAERVAQFLARLGPTVKLFNTYGPTETTVVATSALLNAESHGTPIGLPLAGVRALVRGPNGQRIAPGEAGELYLTGPTLARGYLRRPSLNQERFVVLEDLPGAPRAYRTRDLVRVNAHGELAFVGRVDDELKISGQRVDPREVENALLSHPAVHEAAVIAHARADFGKRLVAYVVTDEPAPSHELLRKHVARRLLAAAVPSAFVRVPRLPRTANGKIDRAALRAMAVDQGSAETRAARSELEAVLLRVWQEVLGVNELSVHDDFFERGGQSMQAIQVASRLGHKLGREIAASMLFRHPTVAGLAAALEGEASVDSAGEAQLARDAVLPAEVRPIGQPEAAPACVLLTGATGFVGVHVLAELLRSTPLRVICLVRAGQAESAALRLREALAAHRLSAPELASRVEVLRGDLKEPRLGLDEARYARLARECDTVIHCAARVSLVRGYASLRADNVLATLGLLRFCAHLRPKFLHHVSTVAAAMLQRDAGWEVPETFVAGRPALRDGYAQSKWVAERLLEQARQRGFALSVYRLGRVVGAADTGTLNPQDLVFRLLRAGIAAGVLPDLDVWEPWTPVDVVARALVRMLHTPRAEAPVYNLVPREPVCLNDVFAWVEAYGYPIARCSLEAFRARVAKNADAEDGATLSFFDQRAGESKGAVTARALTHTAHAERELARHGLAFPAIDRALMHRYLDLGVRTGFFAPPTRRTSHDACTYEPRVP